MNVYYQIIIMLLFIICIQILLEVFLIYKIKNNKDKTSKQGIKIGERIPYNPSRHSGKEKLLLFVDPDCSECQMLINSMRFFKEEHLKDIVLIAKEDIFEDSNINKEIVLIDEKKIKKDFNITLFPFYIELTDDNIVKNKGFYTKNHLIDFLIDSSNEVEAV